MTNRIELEPLPPLRRFLGELAGLFLAFLASPGILFATGSTLLAIVGIALWGANVVRPLGVRWKRALLAEWLAGALGWGWVMWWVWYVYPPTILYILGGWGVWMLLAAIAVRRLARHVSIPVAVMLGWTAVETVRSIIPPPIGLGWLRLGHFASHHFWLAGSARVGGVEGLSLLLAGLAGGIAGIVVLRRVEGRGVILAASPALLAVILSVVTAPPETTAGPRLLLVQPGFSQERKQRDDPRKNFLALRRFTFDAIAERASAGIEPPDLVCWGESMLYVDLFETDVPGALARGAAAPPWAGEVTEELLDTYVFWEQDWVRGGLFGIGPDADPRDERLPPGTSFLAGAETIIVRDEELRRMNGVVLYDAEGGRSPAAGKRFLVPGAETMMGLEKFSTVREVIERVANYVPDFVAAEETGVLELAARDGRTFRFGATVCFDNAFLAPYTEPVRDGPLDFHLIVSNEAWYLESCETDQMLAFSRLIALSTGRSVVRATNSGISTAISPAGRELGRITFGERDRLISGTLLVEVPVPATPDSGASTLLYPRIRTGWHLLLILAPLALLALRRRDAGNPPPPGG